MKRWSMLLIGLGVYAFTLVATAPATLADAGLQRASNGRLRLAESSGTLWSGVGFFEVRGADGQTGIASALSWRLQPGALFRAQLAYEVESGYGSRPFPVTIFGSRIELANADFNMPVGALALGFSKLAPLELTGHVNLRISSAVIRESAVQGSATLEWRSAGSLLAPGLLFGDYALRLDGAGAEIRAILETLQGPLQLRGSGAWARGHAPVFLGTADVPSEFQQQLAPLLRLVAVERSSGKFELQVK